MACAAATRSMFRSSAARNAAASFVSDAKAARSPFRLLSNKPPSNRSFRCAPELSFCVESLLPYHTVTASALMNSMLSVSSCSNCWLLQASNDDV